MQYGKLVFWGVFSGSEGKDLDTIPKSKNNSSAIGTTPSGVPFSYRTVYKEFV